MRSGRSKGGRSTVGLYRFVRFTHSTPRTDEPHARLVLRHTTQMTPSTRPRERGCRDETTIAMMLKDQARL